MVLVKRCQRGYFEVGGQVGGAGGLDGELVKGGGWVRIRVWGVVKG